MKHRHKSVCDCLILHSVAKVSLPFMEIMKLQLLILAYVFTARV